METIAQSPIKQRDLKPYIICKDYLISNRDFEIQIDEESQLLVTTPRPSSSEIGAFYESQEYISHNDKGISVFDKLYKGIRSYMLNKKWLLISQYSKGKTALDIGCGTGEFIQRGLDFGWKIDGIELSSNARSIALAKTKTNIKQDIFDPYFENSKYDVITLWHVLEHLSDPVIYLNKFKEILNPNGIIVIAVPNFKAYDAKHYDKYWAAYDVPRHFYHFSQTAMQQISMVNNMTIEAIHPLLFDSFYVSLLSEQHKTGRKNWLKACYIGLKSNIIAWSKGNKEYSSLIYIIKNA